MKKNDRVKKHQRMSRGLMRVSLVQPQLYGTAWCHVVTEHALGQTAPVWFSLCRPAEPALSHAGRRGAHRSEAKRQEPARGYSPPCGARYKKDSSQRVVGGPSSHRTRSDWPICFTLTLNESSHACPSSTMALSVHCWPGANHGSGDTVTVLLSGSRV